MDKSEEINRLIGEVEYPIFSKDVYLLYWFKLTRKVSLSLNIVSNRVGECVYTSMNISEIMKYLNISESTWFRFIKEAKTNKSVYINRDKVYLNPKYNFNGWNINIETYTIFKNYDTEFLDFIDKHNLSYLTDRDDIYEIFTDSTKRVRSNQISSTLYKLNAIEKHNDKFDYSNTLYKGMKDYVDVLCKKHNMFFSIIAENHLNTQGGCPICKAEHNPYTYFDTETSFYIIKINELYKIGITTTPIARRYAGEGIEYQVVFEKKFNTGKEAFMLEQWCKYNFKKYKYKGVSPFRYTGITEVFTYNIVEDIIFQEKIKGI